MCKKILLTFGALLILVGGNKLAVKAENGPTFSFTDLVKDVIEDAVETGMEYNTTLQITPDIKIFYGGKEVDTTSGWVVFNNAGKYEVVFNNSLKYNVIVDGPDTDEETDESEEETEEETDGSDDNVENDSEENDDNISDEKIIKTLKNATKQNAYINKNNIYSNNYQLIRSAYDDNGKEIITYSVKRKSKDDVMFNFAKNVDETDGSIRIVQSAFDDDGKGIVQYTTVKNETQKKDNLKISGLRLIKKKDKIVLKWKKISGITDYAIQISSDKKFNPKNAKYYFASKNKASIEIPAGKRYYIRIKAFNDVENGKWSKIKSVKLKG